MILSIDQGTTGTTVLLFDVHGKPIAKSYREHKQIYPRESWVEHNPNEIIEQTYSAITDIFALNPIYKNSIKAIGITNQRETTVIWDRKTGNAIMNAIVWQCRRSMTIAERIKSQGYAKLIQQKTGLIPDAYFSATKLIWLFENYPDLMTKAKNNELCFGTIDSWLIWNLTEGKEHVTDFTNASRTMAFNIHSKQWDNELLDIFGIPNEILPRIVNCQNQEITTSKTSIFKQEIPISGIAGDQQAALFGQLCIEKGMIKNTYGTGAFALMYLGNDYQENDKGILTTLAPNRQGKPAYAYEASVFIAGAVVQWLRDECAFIQSAKETEEIAYSVNENHHLSFIPTFVGLGTPYWDSHVKGSIIGLTRSTGKNEIVRSALEAIAFQCKLIFDCMEESSGIKIASIKVDGGASANNFLMQFQADLLNAAVIRPKNIESTAFGAALLAGFAVNFWHIEDLVAIKEEISIFKASNLRQVRLKSYQTWKNYLESMITVYNREHI